MLSSSYALTMDGYSFTHTPMQEGGYTNITREYLANTYGEVVSPEHAEFIIELAKNYDIPIRSNYSGSVDNYFNFYFEDENLVLSFWEVVGACSNLGEKQIAIPLPPKQTQTSTPEEEFEMEQIMKNAGDNLVLGCEDSKCDEWPKIGDEVLVYPNSRRNMEIRGKVVKVIGKCTHSDGSTIITVEHSSLGVFAVANGSWIKKPKTPEEELRDEIADIIDNASCSEQAAEYIVETYGIKKPQ